MDEMIVHTRMFDHTGVDGAHFLSVSGAKNASAFCGLSHYCSSAFCTSSRFMMKIDTSLTLTLPEALSQTGLHFAVATEDDFEEIMAMSQDIYGGLDYLPTRYTSWLQETNRTVVLARKQGKVVRFTDPKQDFTCFRCES